jgi:hypothetical protein
MRKDAAPWKLNYCHPIGAKEEEDDDEDLDAKQMPCQKNKKGEPKHQGRMIRGNSLGTTHQSTFLQTYATKYATKKSVPLESTYGHS